MTDEGEDIRKVFDRPELTKDSDVWARPLLVRGLTVQKDPTKAKSQEDALSQNLAPSFASAIVGRWIAAKLGLGGKSPAPVPQSAVNEDFILDDVNALILPGEATLVLGPSSSGKTTLLKTLYDAVTGKVTPADQKRMKGTILVGSNDMICAPPAENLSRNAAFVDQSDLTLTPILTVGETVRFSRTCAEGDYDFLDESMEAVFKLAGLDHVKHTVVGDADIRGVSGGQKRRVKLLEMGVGAEVATSFLDEITNGLDAASALSICKVIRGLVEITKVKSVVSLLQPSNEVFETFHRVILLSPDGRVAYSGKTEGAIPYFESLGLARPSDMNKPEYLLRCASSPSDFWEEESQGPIASNVATTATLAKSFKNSDAGRALMEEMDRVISEEGEKEETIEKKRKALGRIPAFAQPFGRQVALLMDRGFKLVLRNPISVLRPILAIIFGLFTGTLFLRTSSDVDGTRLRGGFTFTLLTLVFNLAANLSLEDLLSDRITFYTHRKASFYTTTSYYVSQIVTSLPVGLIEAFLQCVLTFFLVGLNNNGGWGFLYFWAMFSLLNMSGTAFARALAYSVPSMDMATAVANIVLLFFSLAAGYSPQYPDLPPWLRWVAWISPMAYCYEAVIVAEVFGRTVETEAGDVSGVQWAAENMGVPRIPYADAPSGMNSAGKILAFDAYMLIVWIVVAEFIGCFMLHYSQKWYGPNTKRYQVSSGMNLIAPPWQKPKDKSVCDKEVDGGDADNELSSIPSAPPAHLTARDTVYEVDIPIVEDQEKEPAASTKEDFEDDLIGPTLTAREYGQSGRGVTKEWAIKRNLGESAIASSRSRFSESRRLEAPRESADLQPPEPGRLRLLSGITASFEPSTMTALMGSSGAGKTTLLDVLAGYKTGGHIDGKVNINGKPKQEDTWKALVGYCEQVDLHNPVMTVRESLVFSARMRLRPFSLADAVKVKFAEKIIRLLELEEFADMIVGNEAAGEGLPKHARKRLTVGVELASNPSILFADEPTSGLDSVSAGVVVSSLQRAAKIEGLTVVCTIHQPSESVFRSFDNLLLLRKGGVCVYNGKIADIDEYLRTVPDGERYLIPAEANPADHVLELFCGPLGEKQDWGELYSKSEMATNALQSFNSCKYGEISVDTQSSGFLSQLYIVLQRQLVAHWRTPTYMAVRFWSAIFGNVVLGLIFFQIRARSNGDSSSYSKDAIGSIFFFVGLSFAPMFTSIVPLVSERAVFYREAASGTYQKVVYAVAVQLAEIPFNVGFAAISFVICYFMVGFNLEGERVVYFLIMSIAMFWILPVFGQLLAFIAPNTAAASLLGVLLLIILQLTMGFLIPPSDIPAWYIWIYWINPFRYMLQGLVANEIAGDPVGDVILERFDWSFDDRWWYCFVAVVIFGVAGSIGIVAAATRISWQKR